MISKKDTAHIAMLARIKLSDIEAEHIEKDIAAILEFVEKLNEVSVEGVSPMTGGTILENVSRADSLINGEPEDTASDLLDDAPIKKDRWIKVRSVFQ